MRPRLAVSFLLLPVIGAWTVDARAGAAERPAEERAAATVVVTVDPPAFSPNGDGRLDETTITVEVDAPSGVRIEVVDPAGTVRRAWDAAASPESPARVVWDGRDDAGRVEDGGFTVRARGSDPVDLVGEGSAPVTIDTRAPSFEWKGAASGGRKGRTRIRFHTNDASTPLHARTEVAGDSGRSLTVERAIGAGGSASMRLGRLYPGNYVATVRIVDALGNVRLAGPFRWRVERPMRGRVYRRVPRAGNRVALTIDDCHFEGAWSSMLRTLSDRRAGATFFCPGQMMRAHAGLTRRTVAAGFAIGSHAWDHALLTRHSGPEVERRLRQDRSTLWKLARRTTAPYFRPPYGAFDRTVVAAAGRTSHPRVVMWDVDTGDWASPGVGTIVSRAVNRAKPGSIILIHTKPQTAAALPAIISGLRDRGLEPVGLPELFAHRTKKRR